MQQLQSLRILSEFYFQRPKPIHVMFYILYKVFLPSNFNISSFNRVIVFFYERSYQVTYIFCHFLVVKIHVFLLALHKHS